MIRQEDKGRFRNLDKHRPHYPASRSVITPLSRTSKPVTTEPQPEIPSYNNHPDISAHDNLRDKKQTTANTKVKPIKSRKIKISKWSLFIALTLLIIFATTLISLHPRQHKIIVSPVPSQYKSTVTYPVFYPDDSKLPSGYKLISNSFSSPSKGIILYKISSDTGQDLIVTLQNKPSVTNLQAFNDRRIPLHYLLNTNAGQAVIGAIGNQTIVSLPTNGSTWIIVAVPFSVSQSHLAQVLKAFRV